MRFLMITNAIIWLGFLWFFLFHVNPGSETRRSCSMLNVTTAEIVRNITETFEVLHEDQAQRRITIPSEIVDPAKSVASKAGEHIATAVASAKQAVSTPLAGIWQNIRSKFFDDLTRWEDTVPVYFCLQTRGVWQLGYPNSTSKIVSSKDFDVLDALQITELDSLFSMARQIVPGLPDGLARDLAEVDFNVLDTMAAAAYWSLVVLLVGTFLIVMTSVLSAWTKWLLCLPLLALARRRDAGQARRLLRSGYFTPRVDSLSGVPPACIKARHSDDTQLMDVPVRQQAPGVRDSPSNHPPQITSDSDEPEKQPEDMALASGSLRRQVSEDEDERKIQMQMTSWRRKVRKMEAVIIGGGGILILVGAVASLRPNSAARLFLVSALYKRYERIGILPTGDFDIARRGGNESEYELHSVGEGDTTTTNNILRLVDGCDLGILGISKERIHEDTGLNAVRPVV
ncbi:hypothetical protein CABS02_15261 [Colletotrichum abscissum]|uniref:Uncharacterized protein n=1 Tax=Colletotrichum abscissum TaxID=1671311 RepID=A0A9Q0AW44_9PEZI|nr:hypothetical protein CABS02_15261 [Colletotrichum abscissum]